MSEEDKNVRFQTTVIYTNGHQNKRTFKSKEEMIHSIKREIDRVDVVAITATRNLLMAPGFVIQHAGSCGGKSCKK